MRCRRKCNRAASALATFPLSFGKYCNVPLARIPRSYLRWMLRVNVPDTDRWAVGRYLQEVAGPRQHRPGRHQNQRIPKKPQRRRLAPSALESESTVTMNTTPNDAGAASAVSHRPQALAYARSRLAGVSDSLRA